MPKEGVRVVPAGLVLALFIAFQSSAAPDQQAIEPFLLVYSRPQVGVLVQSESSKDRLVFNQGPHVAPQLSPDGSRVLFNSVEGGEMGVWIADRSSRRKERVTSGRQAAWSPDGKRIVFQRDGRIYERVLDSGNEIQVSPEGAPPLTFPSYMLELDAAGANVGSRVLCRDEDGKRAYCISRGNPPSLRTLVEGEIGAAPRCSPDGKTLAYQDGAHIHLMDLATRAARQLTTEPGVQAYPVWAADGRSICYVHAHEPLADAWDICQVAIADPRTVNVIEPRVHPGFDWSGTSLEPFKTTKGLGGRLALWRGTAPLDLARGPEGQAGWELVPEGTPTASFDGEVVVENEWLMLHLSRDATRLVPKSGGSVGKPMTLGVSDETGIPAEKLGNVQLVGKTADNLELKASFLSNDNRAINATIRVPCFRPFVEVRFDGGAGRVSIEAGIAFAIVPDRISNDLILAPGQLPPGVTIPLPRTPFVLGCLSDPPAMLMLTALSDGCSFSVGNSEDRRRLTALTARPGEKGVVVALLAETGIWSSPPLVQDQGNRTWSAKWDKPFVAEWRFAARGGDTAWARMWSAAELGNLAGSPLPIDGSFAQSPETAVMYAWARDSVSPAELLTPADVLVDVLGIQGYESAVDIKGIRGYRSGNGSTPFRELIVHPHEWHPAKAVFDESDFGVLEIMGSVFPVGTPGVRSFVTHLGNDAVDLLQGLDTRVGEYETALNDIAAFCDAHKEDDLQGFLTSVRMQAGKLLESTRATPRTDIAAVRQSLEKVLRIPGTRDGLTLTMFRAFCQLPGQDEWAAIYDEFWNYLAAKEGRIWYNDTLRYELWYDDEFKEFSNRCERVLAERQDILAQQRALLKRVRDGAAQVSLTNPDLETVSNELREKARAVLRNRYYLEGDWCGETPLAADALRK